jgi:NDP-sugar pyrophosphorylase family protein
VEPGALIRGPALIGPNSEVRQGAYVRGSVLVGEGCVVGHATEVKNGLFLDGAKAGHFAYVGDSILGFGVNLGAGTKLANLKIIEGTIRLRGPDGPVDTGRRKLGAVLGDGTETGCNSVTSPGALMAPKTMVFPNTTVPAGAHFGVRVFRTRIARGEP